MDMQMNPVSTHSHQIGDPLVDSDWFSLVVCQKHQQFQTTFFKYCLCFTAVLQRKYSLMVLTYECAHGLS